MVTFLVNSCLYYPGENTEYSNTCRQTLVWSGMTMPPLLTPASWKDANTRSAEKQYIWFLQQSSARSRKSYRPRLGHGNAPIGSDRHSITCGCRDPSTWTARPLSVFCESSLFAVLYWMPQCPMCVTIAGQQIGPISDWHLVSIGWIVSGLIPRLTASGTVVVLCRQETPLLVLC